MHTFTHLFTHSLSSLPLNLSHTHSHSSLSLPPHPLTHTHPLTHPLTHSHTLPQSLTHSHTYTPSLSHSPSPTHSHTYSPTHSHTPSHTYTECNIHPHACQEHDQTATHPATPIHCHFANLAPDPFRTRCVGCQACSMDTFTLHTHIGQWYLGATPSTPSETAKQRQGHVGPVFAEAMECVTHNQLHT